MFLSFVVMSLFTFLYSRGFCCFLCICMRICLLIGLYTCIVHTNFLLPGSLSFSLNHDLISNIFLRVLINQRVNKYCMQIQANEHTLSEQKSWWLKSMLFDGYEYVRTLITSTRFQRRNIPYRIS